MATNTPATIKRFNGTDYDKLQPETTWTQVTDKPSTFTPTSHTHGDISNAGAITSGAVTPASGDYLVVTDNSASDVLKRGIAIGTGTTTFLRNDGTWATPSPSSLTDATVTNSATTTVPLTVNAVTSTTANLQEWKINSVTTSFVDNGGYYRGAGVYNKTSSNNSIIYLNDTGTLIQRNVNDANHALIVNQGTGTGDFINMRYNNVVKTRIDTNGYYITDFGLHNYGFGKNYAYVGVPSTGPIIERNVADSVAALKVNLANASATGNIQTWQKAGTDSAWIGNSGELRSLGLYNKTTSANSEFLALDAGAKIDRNVADTNAALIVNQIHASSTGDITKFQFGGVDKAKIAYTGALQLTDIYNLSSANNSSVQLLSTGVVAQRNIADTNPALIANQQNASSTGDITQFKFNGTTKASVDKDGNINIASGSKYKINGTNLAASDVGAAATSHTHAIADVTDVLRDYRTAAVDIQSTTYADTTLSVDLVASGYYMIIMEGSWNRLSLTSVAYRQSVVFSSTAGSPTIRGHYMWLATRTSTASTDQNISVATTTSGTTDATMVTAAATTTVSAAPITFIGYVYAGSSNVTLKFTESSSVALTGTDVVGFFGSVTAIKLN